METSPLSLHPPMEIVLIKWRVVLQYEMCWSRRNPYRTDREKAFAGIKTSSTSQCLENKFHRCLADQLWGKF